MTRLVERMIRNQMFTKARANADHARCRWRYRVGASYKYKQFPMLDWAGVACVGLCPHINPVGGLAASTDFSRTL